jgi:hypothetical protein
MKHHVQDMGNAANARNITIIAAQERAVESKKGKRGK